MIQRLQLPVKISVATIKIDDEGVEAREFNRKWGAQTILMSRSPIEECCTVYGRRESGNAPVVRQGNLFVFISISIIS